MDSQWIPSEWRPTIVFDERDTTVKRYIDDHTNYSKPRRRGKTVELLISSIKACTQAIISTPYSPSVWIDRGKCLLRLQYPELAVGDAYKAALLLKYFRDDEPKIATLVGVEILHELDLDWLSVSRCSSLDLLALHKTQVVKCSHGLWRRAHTLLTQALLCTHSFVEAFEAFKAIVATRSTISRLELLRKTISTAWKNQAILWTADGMSVHEIKDDEKFGAVYVQRYPWMSPELSVRSSHLLRQANDSIRQSSGATCFIGTSKIRGMETDVLGMFAQVRLPTNLRFLQDITNFCADDGSVSACSTCCKAFVLETCLTLNCCKMRFCSETCWDRAETYHKLRCGRDLKDYDSARACPLVSAEKVTEDRALLRVLETLISETAPHPLQSVALGRLTALYDGKVPERFSLAADIARPIDMLTRLGVDVFANAAYDTWVIMTTLARIRTNSRESHVNGRLIIAINPLYSFFNHSCDPNVIDDNDENDTSSTMTLKTTRRVRAKEELFISYLHEDNLELPREERNELLLQWIGRDCGCTRCLNEMAVDMLEKSEHIDRLEEEEREIDRAVEEVAGTRQKQYNGPWVVIQRMDRL